MNVDEHASVEDIKKQYRVLAMIHHPDRNGGSEEKFKQLQEAYETLIDPEKRERLQKEATPKAPSGGSMDGLFQSMFAFHAKQHRHTVAINAQEVMYGCYRTLKLKKDRDCLECDRTGIANHRKNVIQCRECFGKGTHQIFPGMKCLSCNGQGIFVLNHAKCSFCEGKGRIERSEEQVVYIPPGTRDSDVLHPSDELVLIVTHALEGDAIRFDGDNVEVWVEVSPKELLLGFSKQAQVGHTLYRIRSSHCFDMQRTIRLPNKGVHERGDLLLRFRLRACSEEEQALLLKIRNAVERIGLCKPPPESKESLENAILLDVQEHE